MRCHDFDQMIERRGTDSKKYHPAFYPQDVIPMWIADADFLSPEPVVQAIRERAAHGIYGYTHTSERMKQAAAGWMNSRFQMQVGSGQVEFCPGVIGGVIAAIRGLTKPGDRILVQTPAYPPFTDGVVNNGRRIAENPLVLKDGHYEIDFEQFERQCRDPRTKLLILCSPHNPTGRVFTRQELKRMTDICLENHVLIASDEIHCDITYGSHVHIPTASLSEEVAANTISFISPSKTFNLPGFRTAVMLSANDRLKNEAHEILVSNKATGENIFGTVAFCAAYESCGYYADQLKDYLAGNLELVRETMKELPGMELVEPEGTYLFWIDVHGLGMDQEEVMKRFVAKAKVGVQDGLHFGEAGRGFVRINAACPRTRLNQALIQIKEHFYQ